MIERGARARRTKDRKRDAHEKIQLGGLIVKAGLRFEDRAVLLGLLDEARNALTDDQTRERYRRRGKALFEHDSKTARGEFEPGRPFDGPFSDPGD